MAMLEVLLSLPLGSILLLGAGFYIIFSFILWLIDPLRTIPGPILARFTRLWYLYKIYKGDFEKTNVNLHKKYGPVVRIAPNEYSIDDVGAAKVIYGHGNAFVKAPWYWAWMPPDPSKASLFADLDPHRHSVQRRKFASAYSMSSLVGYEPFVDNCSSLFLSRFHEMAQSGRNVNFGHWFQCYAFDVIGEITFGKRFGFLDMGVDEEDVFGAIDSRGAYSTYVGIYPKLHNILFPLLPSTGGHGYVAGYTRSQIASREALLKDPKSQDRDGPPDFVSKFLALRAGDPEKMTIRDIFTICQSNIGAGSDTTAITLSSILYHLLKYPATYRRLRDEIDGSVNSGTISDPITFKEATQLPYLQAVIKEGLRLHSATGLPLSRVVPPCGATLAGQKFPGGCTVGINAWVAHRNTSVYGADADTWRPERWLEIQKNHYGADVERYFFAFGMGSRTCIGKNLSLLEISTYSQVIPYLPPPKPVTRLRSQLRRDVNHKRDQGPVGYHRGQREQPNFRKERFRASERFSSTRALQCVPATVQIDNFFAKSFSEVNPEHKSKYSAWETPDPVFWTSKGYVVVRCDERGLGQSPGLLDTMSRGTSECFFDVVEWAAEQPWSSGKIGLLGISYYAGSQWRVAARKPKGLAAIVPWEGMTDYYRDRCRHGGILSNGFIKFWWNRQVVTNQYGKPGRAASKWGEDTVEGDLPEDVLVQNRNDQNIDNEKNRFLDDTYYASKEFNLEDIEVPVLSVANWGGILLHLRGNVNGYKWAGSKLKYLRFITGRHDLPFYYKEEVEVQRSFLDAFLKGDDRVGWSTPGKVAPVSIILRKGNVGFNNAEAEKVYERREEPTWPLEGTQYTKFYLTPENTLSTTVPHVTASTISYEALGNLSKPQLVQFTSAPFVTDTEITGHVTAHVNVSLTPNSAATAPQKDIDLFVTLRYIDPSGNEVHYTGTAGDPIPLAKGWLRVSLRKVATDHPRHREYQPYHEYRSVDVQEVKPNVAYAADVEVWPTNVIAEKGGRIVVEIASGDTQGSGIFTHTHEKDRSEEIFSGTNNLHFGEGIDNYVTLPIISKR
ncbi:hypothetical protein V494_05668 [Pseudogymnoascus sp. VKM F-4513 (FW-928)]|nr:hypothetical protein V494_05668 [Pseudogymnoascus sp. VKM F-4513 (FW-928)]